MSISQWNELFLGVLITETSHVLSLIGTRCIDALLGGGEDEEGVRLGAEVEESGEGATMQEQGVTLHLEQIILLLPNKGDAFKFAKCVALGLLLGKRPCLLSLSQHEVEDELLAPKDDAFDDV